MDCRHHHRQRHKLRKPLQKSSRQRQLLRRRRRQLPVRKKKTLRNGRPRDRNVKLPSRMRTRTDSSSRISGRSPRRHLNPQALSTSSGRRLDLETSPTPPSSSTLMSPLSWLPSCSTSLSDPYHLDLTRIFLIDSEFFKDLIQNQFSEFSGPTSNWSRNTSSWSCSCKPRPLRFRGCRPLVYSNNNQSITSQSFCR